MKSPYEAWIAQYHHSIGGPERTLGKCQEATQLMAESFPELRRVRGHVYVPGWGERAHWWLVDGSEVVDPTRAQFPAVLAYMEYKEGHLLRVGRCYNCGDDLMARTEEGAAILYSSPFCSQECGDVAVASLNGRI